MHIVPLPGWTILSVVMTHTQRSWRCRFLKRAPVLITCLFMLSFCLILAYPIIMKVMFLLVMTLSLLSNINEIEGYRQCTYRKLSEVTVPAAIFCKNVSCKDSEYIRQIDEYYNSLCNVLTEVSKITIPTCRYKCAQEFIVPGFNEHLKELHDQARQCYLSWRSIGRPRTGDVHNDMRVSRLRFKYALRQCRSNEEMMRADALALSLKNKNSTSFWNDVSKMANSKVPLASKVGDSVGRVEITDMWQTHFSDLLNSVHNMDSKNFVCEHIDAVPPDSNITITADGVRNSLKETRLG